MTALAPFFWKLVLLIEVVGFFSLVLGLSAFFLVRPYLRFNPEDYKFKSYAEMSEWNW